MKQVEFVDQSDQEFLGTTQGGLPRSSSITCWIGSPPERSRITGQHIVSSNAAVDAVVLGSFNYHSQFIEDFAIYASVLYESSEADFHEIRRMNKTESSTLDEKKVDHRKCRSDGDPDPIVVTRGDPTSTDRSRWEKAMISFTILKNKIAKTPILKHFDLDHPPVIVVYASKWAVSASLLQEHDGVYWPVTFTSRTLKPNKINYKMVEKEVLALLRILDIGYTILVAREIKVFTRHSTLAWLVQSSGLNGRLGRWAALLSNWTLEIKKCKREKIDKYLEHSPPA